MNLEHFKTYTTDDFRADPAVPTGSATLEDYKGFGYDRGHLCPAADMVQCGTHNRSAQEAITARDYINSGELGEIVAVNVKSLFPAPVPLNEKENSEAPDTIDWNMWLGPAPLVPYNVTRNKSWHYCWAYGGGEAMDIS